MMLTNKKMVIFIGIICMAISFTAGYFCCKIFSNNNVKENINANNNTITEIIEESRNETIIETEKTLTIEELYNNFSKSLEGIKAGDSLYFGRYEQNNEDSEKENIEWIVLYKSNKNSMMLISKNILDSMPYSYEKENVTWSESDIREFLNNEFYNAAFDDFNKHFIMENKMSNNKNINYKTDAGDDTIDKVFLLSESQASRYFKKPDKNMHNRSRAAVATEYAKNKGIDVTNNENEWYDGNSAYWLRTPGVDNGRAIIVEDNGNLFNYGENITKVEVGVRPCIWIKY